MAASMLRLHFHDCFVNGCGGSILLDDNATFAREKTAAPNDESVRGFDVVDDINAKVEKACPGVVSCAGILAIAARNSTVMLGGSLWKVKLGRSDSTTANRAPADNSIPGPNFSISAPLSSFAAQGVSLKDLVTLSDSHTIGLARCITFRTHLYNDSNIDASSAISLQRKCPKNGKDNVYQPLGFRTPTYFDNLHFKNLLRMMGLLRSDQELFSGTSADYLVKKYAADNSAFSKAFANSMIKMGNIKPLTGSTGEIRSNCRVVNIIVTNGKATL